ncbi:MAG: tyrosine-type recombinase/integrase [Clostridia bacterium]|nr:tyrosine-type recombinase/integrase [Clostridia bacterium]
MKHQYAIPLHELPVAVQEFAAYKSGIQNCSEKTVSEYLLDLRTFFRYIVACREGIDLESEEFLTIDIRALDLEFIGSIRTTEIYAFLQYTGTVRKNLWAAKARKLVSIRMLYRYLVTKTKQLRANPAADIEAPKKKQTLPKFLSLEESILLLDTIKNDKRSRTVVRDYAIVTLFLNCGMRVSELCGINLTDINREMQSLRVTGKGAKERIIYLNDACQTALSEYLPIRLAEKNGKTSKEKALFLSGQNNRISVKTVQWMVYKYLDLAGLGERRLSVHKLRHTAATLMYQTGEVDVRVLKDILGHEQLNTTQIYTHVSSANMQAAMSHNPLSGITRKSKNTKETEHDD